MATWKTEETRIESRWWRLAVVDEEGDLREEGDPTPADYIAALRAETEEVRAEVVCELYGRPYEEACLDRDQARSDLATVTAERDAELQRVVWLDEIITNNRKAHEQHLLGFAEKVARVEAERDALRARLDGAVAEIAAEDEPPDWGGCRVEIGVAPGHLSQDMPWVKLRGDGYTLWSPLPRVLAEIARSQPGALLAAADKLRPVAHCDGSEPTGIVGEWDGDAIVYPGGSCRPVREAGFVGIEVVSCGHANWLDIRNALALLSRAELLPKATTDRETRAVLALMEWSHSNELQRIKKRIYGGYLCWPDYRRDDQYTSSDNAVEMCAKLGIEVP